MPSPEGKTIEGRSHKNVTALAFDLVGGLDPVFQAARGKVITESEKVDEKDDLELVLVQGLFFLFGRDDPHRKGWYLGRPWQDIPSYESNKRNILKGVIPDLHWTALNHYIDIRARTGTYDDYDGYSYYHGSASKDQHQIVPERGNLGIDTVINGFLSMFYVHAPGQQWYDGCSPSVERYSSNANDILRRFPRATWPPRRNNGVPESVFLPVDNMARYWFDKLDITNVRQCLGYVLHALQDAAVPHHAAGCAGNFHTTYEKRQIEEMARWKQDAAFATDAVNLFEAWKGEPGPSPPSLSPDDHGKTPGFKWEIDMLVTWLAVNAYKEFKETYGGFAGGAYIHDPDSMRGLALKATAASMLALAMANEKLGN